MATNKGWGVVGGININALLAFIFGAVFLAVLLVIAVFAPPDDNPTSTTILVAILAIAAAGVGAVVPGMLNINLPIVKAGGALGLFVLVWSTQPAILSATRGIRESVVEGTTAQKAADAYLALLDTNKVNEAWAGLDADARMMHPLPVFMKLVAMVRTPLGSPIGRDIRGQMALTPLPGYPEGSYTVIDYRTAFTSGCRLERVTLRQKTERSPASVFDHSVLPEGNC